MRDRDGVRSSVALLLTAQVASRVDTLCRSVTKIDAPWIRRTIMKDGRKPYRTEWLSSYIQLNWIGFPKLIFVFQKVVDIS